MLKGGRRSEWKYEKYSAAVGQEHLQDEAHPFNVNADSNIKISEMYLLSGAYRSRSHANSQAI